MFFLAQSPIRNKAIELSFLNCFNKGMRRVFLILLLFFLTLIKIQNDGVVNAACDGVGNYCVGRVVQSWGNGCIQEGGQCNPRWTSIHTYNCAPNTCTTNVFTRDFGGICNTSSCTANSYPDWTELSCCLYGGGGGGGGGSYSCPGGTYSQRLDECRNECNAGWQSGGDCDPDPCGNNAQGDPKVCCHKGVCTPEKTQNFSFSCNSDNTVTFAWSVNPAATRYALRVNDLSNGWVGDQKNNNCSTINPGDACVNDLPIDPTLYTFPITYGNVYNAWIYTVAGSRMSEEASYLYNITCAAPTPTPFPCPANINQSCNGSGTQATISWDPIAAAVGYVLRLNHEPYDAPANWYNGAQGDQWQEPAASTILCSKIVRPALH